MAATFNAPPLPSGTGGRVTTTRPAAAAPGGSSPSSEIGATAAILAHEAEVDPHPQYTTTAEATTIAEAKVTAHEAAANPHPQYLTETEADLLYEPLGGGGGGLPGGGYAQYLAASLEPDAIEAVQKGTFTYTVNSTTTKMLLASYATRLGASGRMEQRNPQRAAHLRGCTLTGLTSSSTAILLNPQTVTYPDPWATYYARMQAILELPVYNLGFTGTGQQKPFLPGAHGAIIVQYTCFDLAWLVLRPLGSSAYGINLWDEIHDSTTQRLGNTVLFPIHKKCAGLIESSATGSSPSGSISYVLLPASWSAVTDPLSYTFRDTFMTTPLDTGVWTRVQSTVGNVEIEAESKWCKLAGNSTWGANGLYRTATQARASGLKMVIDVFVPLDAASVGAFMVGWGDGAGSGVANFSHGLNFAAAGVINVFENSNARGTVGSGYTVGCIYRVRITLSGANSAVYEIQGGPEYAPFGEGAWTDITPGTSSSSTTPLTPLASAFAGNGYINDVRVHT